MYPDNMIEKPSSQGRMFSASGSQSRKVWTSSTHMTLRGSSPLEERSGFDCRGDFSQKPSCCSGVRLCISWRHLQGGEFCKRCLTAFTMAIAWLSRSPGCVTSWPWAQSGGNRVGNEAKRTATSSLFVGTFPSAHFSY